MDALRAACSEMESPPFEVWPENWPVIELWCRVQTQWRVAPMGGLLGLDYQAVDMVLRLTGAEQPLELFDDLREMERAALEAMARP